MTPATPLITEPASDGQVISPFDVHMVAGPFSGAPGEGHVCTDWEIRALPADEAVWAASCVASVLAVHIHLGDGEFLGSRAGRHELQADLDHKLRVRFRGDAGPAETQWSEWAERLFHTAPATGVKPLVVSDAASIPVPRWVDASARDVVVPAGAPAPSLRLEVAGVGTLLEFLPVGGGPYRVWNPPALSTHGPLRVVCDAAGAVQLDAPASRVTFTDGSGEDRVVYLPPISLSGGQTADFLISESGGAFAGTAAAPGGEAEFISQLSESPVPWAVKQPGFQVDLVATGFQLPVNIAFPPDPGENPDDPFFYVTELYGTIKVVTRSGAVRDYATALLNFDPMGDFPGAGEKGLAGIVVEPESGDLFASLVYENRRVPGYHFPTVIRLHSEDGGLTAASQSTVLDFPTEPQGPSHQISSLSIGPDGNLYVHMGDGLLTLPAQDLNSVRGKILRVHLDGSAPRDNPFFDAVDGIRGKDLVFAWGLRNPFGGAWRAADGALWEVENGPSVDRLAKVVAGRNYGWDGTDASMATFAAYNWPVAHSPVNIAFVQPQTFGGSGFPSEKMDHAFVAESGPTYASGPQATGKRVEEFVLDLEGNLVAGPVPLVDYIGAGKAAATALAAGPDGLYFADLYKDFGASSPTERGANVFRIRYAGIADFAADLTGGQVPLSVQFQDLSQVPSPAAWRWEFGDGEASVERNPLHTYRSEGVFDVRLTVTGSGGEAVRQKNGLIFVDSGAVPRPPPCSAGDAPCNSRRLLPPR